MPIGTPSYDTKRVKTQWWYLTAQQPMLILKVLPPLGSLWNTGQWFKFAAIHWSQPDSNKRKYPFFCVEERARDRKQITVVCPYCAKAATARAEYEAKKAAGVAPEHLEPLYKMMLALQSTRGYYFNAQDLSGQFGVLRLPKTGRDALEREIQSLRKDIVRPIDPLTEGAYFEFTREGAGLQTRYFVKRHEDVVEVDGGRKFRDIKCVKLTAEEVAAIDTPRFTGRDLNDLALTLTVDEVALLASGDTLTVDRVFERAKQAQAEDVEESGDSYEAAPATPTTPPPVEAAPASVSMPPASVSTPAPASVSMPPASVSTPAPASVSTTPPANTVGGMTEQQLMELYKNSGV